jgi:RNA polymerase sigma factor (sigma-70 family)
MGPEAGAADDRRAVLELVARGVRVRFRLTLEAFADRLLELARVEGAGVPPALHVARLSLDDLYLASACAQGDERAWEECAARHFGFIRDFARRRLRGPQAEETADQVIADLWQRGKLARFSGRSSLRTWLGAVVAHAAVNAAKAARLLLPLDAEPAGGARAPGALGDGDAAEAERRAAVAELVSRALGALGADDRLLLLLYFEQELTLDEIVPLVGHSKAWLSRRLKSLREALRGDVERLAREAHATGSEWLRAGLDLSRVPLDLARALSKAAWKEQAATLSKTRGRFSR